MAIYLWAFMFGLSLVMLTIYPILIAPLFNKFTPVRIVELSILLTKMIYSIAFSLFVYIMISGL